MAKNIEGERKVSPALILIPVVAGIGLFALTQVKAAPPTVYTCPHCGANFPTYEALATHIETQHPGAYVCPYCEVGPFTTLAEVNEHITLEHPGERLLTHIIWT